MSKQKIKLEVEGLKISPLRFFMDKQGKNLEEEIVKGIDTMYEKYVPVQTREFIDSQLTEESQEEGQQHLTVGQGTEGSSGGKSKRTPRQPKLKNTSVQNGVPEVIPEAAPSDVQDTGITQRM
ncbi:hypothetical protein MKD14_15520 [[Clostridium] innocuum]|nr:hypothetical protein [[Clostridium] innocuum]